MIIEFLGMQTVFSVICYGIAYFKESLFRNCFPVGSKHTAAVHDPAAEQAAFVNLVECFAGFNQSINF